MDTVGGLHDNAKNRRSHASDMALAAALGVSRSIVSEWRKGTKFPSEDHVCALAHMAGEDEARWLVVVQAERTTGPAHKAWTTLARQLGAAAALAVVALLPYSAIAGRSDSAIAVAEQQNPLCIMRSTYRSRVDSCG